MNVEVQSTNVEVQPTPDGRALFRSSPEQRLFLDNVDWDAYELIGQALCDRPALRLTYDDGRLEIMTTSPPHEFYKRRLSRFIELLAEECNRPFETAGNMTFRNKDVRKGIEADDCFWIAHEPQMRGRLEWYPDVDPPPDLALEIEMSRSVLNRLGIYAALRIPEVWRFNGETLRILVLQDDGAYHLSDTSLAFPEIAIGEIVRFLEPDPTKDSLSLSREFRAWVQEQRAKAPPGPQ